MKSHKSHSQRTLRLCNLKQLLALKQDRLQEMEKEVLKVQAQMQEDKLNKQLLIVYGQEHETARLEEELKDLGIFQENLQESMAMQMERMKLAQEALNMAREDLLSHLLRIQAYKEKQIELATLNEDYELKQQSSLCYYQIVKEYDTTSETYSQQVAQQEITWARALKSRDTQLKKTYHIEQEVLSLAQQQFELDKQQNNKLNDVYSNFQAFEYFLVEKAGELAHREVVEAVQVFSECHEQYQQNQDEINVIQQAQVNHLLSSSLPTDQNMIQNDRIKQQLYSAQFDLVNTTRQQKIYKQVAEILKLYYKVHSKDIMGLQNQLNIFLNNNQSEQIQYQQKLLKNYQLIKQKEQKQAELQAAQAKAHHLEQAVQQQQHTLNRNKQKHQDYQEVYHNIRHNYYNQMDSPQKILQDYALYEDYLARQNQTQALTHRVSQVVEQVTGPLQDRLSKAHRNRDKIQGYLRQIQGDIYNMGEQERDLKEQLRQRELDKQQAMKQIKYEPGLLQEYNKVNLQIKLVRHEIESLRNHQQEWRQSTPKKIRRSADGDDILVNDFHPQRVFRTAPDDPTPLSEGKLVRPAHLQLIYYDNHPKSITNNFNQNIIIQQPVAPCRPLCSPEMDSELRDVLATLECLLVGMPVLRRYNNQSVMKQPSFDPTNYELSSPEACGYAPRKMKLEKTLDRLLFIRPQGVESSIQVEQLVKVQVSQSTRERAEARNKGECPYFGCLLVLREREPEEILLEGHSRFSRLLRAAMTLAEQKDSVAHLRTYL